MVTDSLTGSAASSSCDLAVAEFAELKPRLVDGLIFRPVGPGPGADVRVENPADRRFHDLGHAEYVVLSQFDGRTSAAEAVSLAARQLREDAPTLDEVAALCEWAAGAELLRLPARVKPPSLARAAAAANPLWLNVPLPSPQRLVDAAMPALGWTQSPPALLGLLLLTLAAACSAALNSGQIVHSLDGILASSNWLSLALACGSLKLWHELGHALACRRYGVEIPKSGVVFILLAPCPFVDATASWRLPSRWHRIHIAAAGMLAELAVAAVLLLSWPWLTTPWLQQTAVNAVLAATLTTVLFNANPLMRFDGYFILSDAFACRNLATRGGRAVSDRLIRVLTGRRPKSGEPAAVEAYGWAASAWRVVVTVSLVAGADVLWPGVGLAIGVFGAAATLVPSLTRFVRQLHAATPSPAARIRAAAVATCGGVALSTLGGVPWPFGVRLPAVVHPPELTRVVAPASGFVEQVAAADGAAVSPGQVVLRLRDDRLASERRGLAASLRGSLAAQRSKAAGPSLLEAQVEADRRLALLKRQRLLDDRAARLTVTARSAGTLAGVRPSELLGVYVREGQELGLVHGDGAAELRAFAADDLVDHFRGREQTAVTVTLPVGRTIAGTLLRISPTAARDAVDPSLTVLSGGPVAVTTPAAATEADATQTVLPHFTLSVRTDRPLPVGMRAWVRVESGRSTAHHLWSGLRGWWQSLVEPA